LACRGTDVKPSELALIAATALAVYVGLVLLAVNA
jgi:hypothetical protein